MAIKRCSRKDDHQPGLRGMPWPWPLRLGFLGFGLGALVAQDVHTQYVLFWAWAATGLAAWLLSLMAAPLARWLDED